MLSSLWPPRTLGGAERYAFSLAEHLDDRGWDVGALTLGVEADGVVASVRPWPYRLEEYEAHSRATRAVFHALDVYRPGVAGTIRRAIEGFEPDVVHSHSIAGLSTVALTTAGRFGVAEVHTLHDYWLLCRRSSLVKSAGTACQPRCVSCRVVCDLRARVVARHPPQVVIAVSKAVAREHEVVPWMRGRMRVVRNPVTPVLLGARVPPSGEMTFGFLGRLTREKGVTTLVDAFARAQLPAGTRLRIAGEGPMQGEIERRAVAGVELVGWVDDAAKDELLRQVDCLVVPSEWPDPAPLVIDEARARRIPVIGARAGGIPELVSPTNESLLFPSRDADALARSLRAFAAEPARYRDEGEGLGDWDAHLDAVVAAYDDAIAAR